MEENRHLSYSLLFQYPVKEFRLQLAWDFKYVNFYFLEIQEPFRKTVWAGYHVCIGIPQDSFSGCC